MTPRYRRMTAPAARPAPKVGVLAACAVVLGGCAEASQQQSMLSPSGTGAQAVDVHWQTMLVLGVAVWLVVVAILVTALLRRRRRDDGDGRRAPLFVAVAGAVVPAIIVGGLMAQSVVVLQETNPADADGETLVEVTGHQFWWEVQYPEHGVVTANEIHIPTGERVQVEVTSNDVIHSVWVPQLSGKMDMVPGRANTMWLETEEPGTYWGQCAEYCGLQHAQMRFVVVAHEPAEFEGWVAAQAEPAESALPPADGPETDDGIGAGVAEPGDGEAEPADADELVARGREVFMSSSCVYCHTVAGTEALGRVGPDLTHLASRETLAAGVLTNNRGNLAAWIVDPQSIKPGNEMPGTDLAGDELQALLTYLESLE